NTTGLMWKRCAEGQVWAAGSCVGSTSIFTWQNALQHTADTNLGAAFAGHSDWRVPNIQELQSILEEQCSNPTINAQVFPATSIITPYWSASPWVGNSVSAWGVRFDIGIAGAY